MLIEIAVASFVIGVCLLALLAVARTGQQAATEGGNEMRATLFAQDAFTTLRLFSDRAGTDEDPAAWTNFWIGLSNGKALEQFPGFIAVGDSDEDIPYRCKTGERPPSLNGDGNVHTNIWRTARFSNHDELDPFFDHAVQYRLVIPGYGEENKFSSQHIQISLHVWNGLYRDHPETFTFFRIFTNPGRMP